MFLFVFTLLLLEKGRDIKCTEDNGPVSYKGFQVWQANIQEKNLSSDFENKISTQDVWRRDDDTIDFLLNASETDSWRRFLGSQNVSYKVILDDLQDAIDKEAAINNIANSRRGINWVSYPKLNEIYAYLQSVVNANPKFCKLETLGRTAHRKDIKMLVLSNGNKTNRNILVEAGTHAREWVAVSSLLYLIEKIARNFSDQPAHIKNHNWYLIPVLNPDGYEYSMTKDRMWRKNRARFSGPCDGVDLNRNYASDWGQGTGTSHDTCSIFYCGPVAFSEPETTALAGLALRVDFSVFVSVHSYGSQITFPWAANGQPTPDVKNHIYVAKRMADVMQAECHERFKYGTVRALGIDKGSGMAVDYMYRQGIMHTYLIETRGASSNQFMLEPNQILPSGKEVAAGLIKLVEIV